MIDPGLRLPADPARADRRLRLLSTHDQNFQRWLTTLPPQLAAFAASSRTYLGAEVDLPPANGSLRSPAAIATAWLFWESFADLDDGTFLAVAEAGACHQLASVILDHLVDGQLPEPGPSSLLYKALEDHSHSEFLQVFPPRSPFWAKWEGLGQRHLAGLAAELEGRSDPRRFTYDQLEIMARGKASPVVVTAAALCVASGRTEWLEPIARSMELVGVASQLVDDVQDWRKDAEAQHLTYFLCCLAPGDTRPDGAWPSVDDLARRLESEAVDTEHLRQAVTLLDQAVQEAQGIPCPDWISYIRTKRLEAEQLLKAALARALVASLAPDARSAGD